MDTYKWVQSSAYSSMPSDAIAGGNEPDGAAMYVGRAFHNGDTLVAKVLPAKHIGFVTWRGEVIPKEHFEILCGQNLIWRHCYDHLVPDNAVLCGETSIGQPVYIGRGHYNGSLIIGKISSVHRALFIAYSGSEKRLESYEILVHEKVATPGWAIPTPLEEKLEVKLLPISSTTPPPPPPPLAPPAYTSAVPHDPPPPYAPFTYTPQHPEIKPKFMPSYETIPEKKFNYTETYVQPLAYAPPPSQIVTPAETYVPPTAPPVPIPAEVFVPPSINSIPHDVWLQANENFIPPNAFRAGQDTDLSSLYVCRAFHNGQMLPGKANPSHRCAYICCDGQEIRKYNFEVLSGERYRWIPAYNGNIPPGAIEGGRSLNGEVLYIGRAHHNGSLTPGKVHPSHNCLYIPYGGREVRISNYEVLVRW